MVSDKQKEYQKRYYNNHSIEICLKATIARRTPTAIEYRRKYQKESARQLKLMIIDYKGGKCSSCGIIATAENACIFDLHHINSAEKEKRIGYIRNFDKAIIESDKCLLLCSNCHRLIHRRKE